MQGRRTQSFHVPRNGELTLLQFVSFQVLEYGSVLTKWHPNQSIVKHEPIAAIIQKAYRACYDTGGYNRVFQSAAPGRSHGASQQRPLKGAFRTTRNCSRAGFSRRH